MIIYFSLLIKSIINIPYRTNRFWLLIVTLVPIFSVSFIQIQNKQLMPKLVDYSRISYLWAAILYQWASSVFLITVSEKTEYISAIGYLVGSAFFALSDIFAINDTSGFHRVVNYSFLFADSMFTIGSVFFFPTLDMVIIGNILFQTGGCINFINHVLKFISVYRNPTASWKIQVFSRVFNCFGTVMFVVANILLIHNANKYFTDAFIIFTAGSVGFTLGGIFSFIQHKQQEKLERNDTHVTSQLDLKTNIKG